MNLCSRKSDPREEEELGRFAKALGDARVLNRVDDVLYDSNCNQCFITTNLKPDEIGGYTWRDIEIAAVASLTCYSIDNDVTKHGAPCRCSDCVPPSTIDGLVIHEGGRK
jgi:hypothetical protein